MCVSARNYNHTYNSEDCNEDPIRTTNVTPNLIELTAGVYQSASFLLPTYNKAGKISMSTKVRELNPTTARNGLSSLYCYLIGLAVHRQGEQKDDGWQTH
jgi:hypothetical protein